MSKEVALKEDQIEEKDQEVLLMPAVRPLDPHSIILSATRAAEALMEVVEQKGLYQKIGEKKYLQYEAWVLLGRFNNLTPVVEYSRPCQYNESSGWEARVRVLDGEGREVSAAESMCLRDEPNWRDKPEFQLRSMAQTRAASKALRMKLGFVAALAGFEPTPAEELEPFAKREEKKKDDSAQKKTFALIKRYRFEGEWIAEFLRSFFGVESRKLLKKEDWERAWRIIELLHRIDQRKLDREVALQILSETQGKEDPRDLTIEELERLLEDTKHPFFWEVVDQEVKSRTEEETEENPVPF